MAAKAIKLEPIPIKTFSIMTDQGDIKVQGHFWNTDKDGNLCVYKKDHYNLKMQCATFRSWLSIVAISS
jgi:hypothetical protein